MTRQEARQQINARLITDYVDLKPSKGVNKYICPMCGSGTGKHNSGALTLDRDTRRLMCYACPENTGFGKPGQDTLGALRVIWGCSEDDVFARCGLTIDRQSMPMQRTGQAQAVSSVQSQNAMPSADLTQYFAECRSRLRNPDAISYLQARGIGIETAEICGIGYDAQCDAACSGHKSARLIMPTSSTHYVARAIAADVPKQYQKLNNKGGRPSVFNAAAIYSGADAVFVTEGIFDAMSVIEAGCQAIALNSVSNCGQLIKMLEAKRTDATFILCLDSDSAGQNATDKLAKDLQRLNISYIIGDVTNGHKDANEALCADREAFFESVHEETLRIVKPDAVSLYISRALGDDLDKYTEAKDRKTGFATLDSKMSGLYAGLYVVGAVSSLGKTTFMLQIADQLAAAGEDVLFFSLEQSRLELVSKSIARIIAQNDITQAVNSLSLRRGNWTAAAQNAITDYVQMIGDRLSIIEGNFACNISFIGEYIRKYIDRTQKKPVVFIDYLQILQPEKDKRGRTQGTKETVDHTVTELKRISREHGLTVFVVSSFNRMNYSNPVDFESFKESGGIEYTADFLCGLQLKAINDVKKADISERKEKLERAKLEIPRKIEFVCLKNRYGVSRFNSFFDYYPHCDLYIEDAQSNKEYDDQRQAVQSAPKRK